MDTKSKSFSYSKMLKGILTAVFTLCFAGIGAVVAYVSTNEYSASLAECLVEPNFFNSNKYAGEVTTAINRSFWTASDIMGQSESYISTYFNSVMSDADYTVVIEQSDGTIISNTNDNFETLKGFAVAYKYADGKWEASGDVSHRVSLKAPAYYASETYENEYGNVVVELRGYEDGVTAKAVAFGWSREILDEKTESWANLHEIAKTVMWSIVALGTISIVALVWLLIIAGKTKTENGVENTKRAGITNLFVEVQLGLLALAVLAVAFLVDMVEYATPITALGNIERAELALRVGVGATAGLIFGVLSVYSVTSMVIKLKHGVFLNSSISFRLLRFAWKYVLKILKVLKRFACFIPRLISGEAYHKNGVAKAMLKMDIAFTAVTVVLMLFYTIAIYVQYAYELGVVLALLEILAFGLYLYGKWRFFINDISKLENQIDKVYNGDFNTPNELSERSNFYETARKVSSISENFARSVEESVHAERMKIDLVTNVSHDLKTPLTSVISYVDLLSKVEDLPDEAKDYVKILSQKSERLKNIVSDVFELAKTSSGEITVEKKRIDLCKLTVQTLADMDDKIKASGLQFRTVLPEEPCYIVSDGKRIYRVMQNLVDNALKYSLKGTRVYITLESDGTSATVSVKNTSEREMNFTKQDVLERFSRGDKSRTTEGSGLGLSIAQGFVIACGGEFDIELDGDLFKVIMKFPLDVGGVELDS